MASNQEKKLLTEIYESVVLIEKALDNISEAHLNLESEDDNKANKLYDFFKNNPLSLDTGSSENLEIINIIKQNIKAQLDKY